MKAVWTGLLMSLLDNAVNNLGLPANGHTTF